MADTIAQQILRQSLNFSYSEIQSEHPEWSERSVSDYFYKQSNIYALAANSKSSDDQVEENTDAILVNTENISINSGAIEANTSDISGNTNDISTNATNIGNNTTAIGTNATNLTNHLDNTSGAHAASAISYGNVASGLTATDAQAAIDEVDELIGTNSTNITSVTGAFNAHNGSYSQHGVTGSNVGTGDYCTAILGGVVDLAAEVTNAVASTVSVTSPDATDLPTALTLANETKADVNQLVADLNDVITQLNEFLANNKTAKQMAS
ncbi:MAG: hypothetical protein V7765_21160 [Oleispira sp.]